MKGHHISVCVCTFRRAELLRRLLERLEKQQTEGLFTYAVVVADNDSARSAEHVVAEFSANSHLSVTYCFESQQNIALARNRAVQHTDGDLIAFIDDDEFPADDWLCNLFKTCMAQGVAGVLGPVKPRFESEPPRWVKDGKFFERPTYAAGHIVTWTQARTGNVLLRKDILGVEAPFRPEFDTAGEDVDFFRRMIEKGFVFVWCDDAIAYEVIPSTRCNRTYLLKRALLRGSNFSKHPTQRLQNATKSLIAVPCYAVALPFLALFGQHVFLKYLIKLLDHFSRVLSYLGLPVVTQRQT